MKTIKIYNTRQAKKDLKNKTCLTPIDAAIAKWESLWSTLAIIHHEMLSRCGLCLAHDLCKDCPLSDCSEIPTFKQSNYDLRATMTSINTFLKVLYITKEKQNQ